VSHAASHRSIDRLATGSLAASHDDALLRRSSLETLLIASQTLVVASWRPLIGFDVLQVAAGQLMELGSLGHDLIVGRKEVQTHGGQLVRSMLLCHEQQPNHVNVGVRDHVLGRSLDGLRCIKLTQCHQSREICTIQSGRCQMVVVSRCPHCLLVWLVACLGGEEYEPHRSDAASIDSGSRSSIGQWSV